MGALSSRRSLRGTVRIVAAAACALACGAATAQAQVVLDSVPALAGIDVIEHLGDTISLDLSFIDDHGDSVRLERYFHQGRPVILTLAYSNCPMLCTAVLGGLANGMRTLAWQPGEEFSMIEVSIDPLETVALAAAKKKRYNDVIGKPGTEEGWAFLVGAESQSRALADAVGFKYFYDEDLKQYGHPAVCFVLTEEGVISRYLYGIEFAERDLRLALLEASEGKIGSTIDRILLYCYRYDPDAGGYVLFAANVMRLGGALTLAGLALLLGIFWTREARRRKRGSETAAV